MTGHSVHLGVYAKDDAAHLAAALDSLLGQSAPSDDIVIAVDGPIDGALRDTVTRYADANPQIRPIYLPVNVGQGLAAAETVPQCRHDIVFKMDADDVCMPDRMARQLNFLEAHPEVAILSAHLAEFDGDVDNVVSHRRVPLTHEQIAIRARRWNPFNHPAVVFRKSAVQAVGGYRHVPRFEDYDLWVRLLMAGYRTANVDEALVRYRVSQENLDRRRSWAATRSAWTFHLWKHRVGFAGPGDTAAALTVLTGAALTPGPIYRWVYRHSRA